MEGICVNDLKKSFGNVTAVDIPKLIIEEGDFLGIVGNNGAGKTTFLRLMLDLAKADTGSISLSGTDPSKSEDWKTTTGAYLDAGFLIDFLTPEEYFDFIAKANGIANDSLQARLSSMETFMNGEILGKNKFIRSFSAGNKQKIGIVSALINMPKLLILDEPFNFLDPSSQISLKDLLSKFHKEKNATIIVSSHNLQHVADICNHIVVMEHGSFIKDVDCGESNALKELNEYFKK